MAIDRFELSPDKPGWVRGFSIEGLVEFECHDIEEAEVLLTVLNRYVSDIVIDRHHGSASLLDATRTIAEWLPV